MAFSHHKFSIGGEQTAGQAVSYLADPQAVGDYYTEADHAFMRWLATPRARTVLGLNDQVELWKVERLLKGQHPASGALIRRWGPNRTMVGGQDCTLSPAPKSLSVLWALADQELRNEIEVMVGQAASGAMAVMLRHVRLIHERYGPGPNDRRFVKADDYVAVQALHTTARLTEAKPGIPDPDLHLHSVVFGAVDQKGNLRAIESRQILNYGPQLAADASAQLAEFLRLRGFEIERELIRDARGKVKRVAWEVKGVPRELIKAMSSRSQEIEDLKVRYREKTGREAEGPGWEAFVTTHRGPKAKRTAAELREAWVAEAREHDYGPEAVAQAKAEANARRATGSLKQSSRAPEAEQFREEILADLTREHALVPDRKLDILALQRAAGLLAPDQAQHVIAEMFGDGDLLMTSDGLYVTTLEVLAHEQRAVQATDQLLRSRPAAAASREQLLREFQERKEPGDPFDQAQREAIAVATSGARFVSIAGPAGTGKGYASRAMVNLWHEQGRRVLALAVAGRTSQQAQVDSGADAQYTLDGLYARLDYEALQLRPTDVLLVDEAAMVDHKRYVPLLEATVASGATLVQVGDDKQLSPVEAGGLWTVTHAMAEERAVAVELQTVRRARNPAEAEAWTDIRNGNVEKGLMWYRGEGRLHLYENRPGLLQGIVHEWWTSDPSGVVVLDSSNAERDTVNRLAQAKRLEAGELGAEALTLANGREIRAGDRLLFNEIHQLNRDLNPHGPRIENGTPATVLSLGTVELDDRSGLYAAERGQRGHQLPAERGVRGSQYEAEIKAAAPAPPNVAVVQLHEPAGDRHVAVGIEVPVELGYARHVYKAQGMTAEVANIATGPQTSQERLYVMASRSREGTHIHALRSEVEELGAEPAQLEPEQVQTPVEAPAAEIPEGARPWAEVSAELDAAQKLLEQREVVTVREMSQRARPEAKRAAGPAEWADAAEPRGVKEMAKESQLHTRSSEWEPFLEDHKLNPRHQVERQAERSTSPEGTHQRTSDEVRATTRQLLQERLEAAHQAARERGLERVPSPMPARTAAETVARGYAERGNTAELLAMYRMMGRLDFAANPELAAVERASQQPGALIIAQDAAQRERLQKLLNERSESQSGRELAEAEPGQTERPHSAQERPTVALAQDLYRQRADRRAAWSERTNQAQRESGQPAEPFQHHVEPGAIDRAVVVVTDHKDAQSLSRGLSGAAEAHLVTGQPDWLTSEAIRLRADQLGAQQQARLQQQGERQGAEAQQELGDRSRSAEAERSAERSGAQHEVEHQGAER